MRLTEKLFWKITIGFGLIAALIGLSLRYYFMTPLPFNFRYMLHAHSHLMLLGWLFNALLLLLYQQWNMDMVASHKGWFVAMCICVAGMLFSFPFQGYAAVSITFSTLHLWFSYILLIGIWRLSRGRGLPGKLVRTGIVFFFLSTVGPYSLGPMMANNMQGSPWYDQAIFFYLHFQYNGAFLFFMLAFMIEKWEIRTFKSPRTFHILMVAGAVLTWFHSLDYSFDSPWINIAGFIGALFQLVAGGMLIITINRKKLPTTQLLVLGMLGVKWLFQLLGSLPVIADAAIDNRFYLIAYLHFIFLGIYTPFIWSVISQGLKGFSSLMGFYWVFFLLTEAVLVVPSLYQVSGFGYWPHLTFMMYVPLIIIWSILAFRTSFELKLRS